MKILLAVRPSGLGTWVSDVNEASIISVSSGSDNAAVSDSGVLI